MKWKISRLDEGLPAAFKKNLFHGKAILKNLQYSFT